jgi:hypothetical protein
MRIVLDSPATPNALASAREQPLRTGWFYLGFAPLRLDRVRLGVRNEAPEAGHYQCPLLYFPSAAPHRYRRRAVPGVTQLLGGDRDRVGRGLARAIDALRLATLRNAFAKI